MHALPKDRYLLSTNLYSKPHYDFSREMRDGEMSVSAQIIFPYMSDARAPAMDVLRTAQHACKVRSFQVTDVYVCVRV